MLPKTGFLFRINLARAIASASKGFQEQKEWLRIFVPERRIPKPGELLKQKDLAWTLNQIATEGRSAFYESEIARRIQSSMTRHGGLLDREDLSSHKSQWVEPVSTRYRGFRIYETAPNSQGITALIALNILNKFDLSHIVPGSAEYIQLIVECCRVAQGSRRERITDPAEMKIKPNELLAQSDNDTSLGVVKAKSSKHEILSSTRTYQSREAGDTTYFSVVDKERNCVYCIQSLYFGLVRALSQKGRG